MTKPQFIKHTEKNFFPIGENSGGFVVAICCSKLIPWQTVSLT